MAIQRSLPLCSLLLLLICPTARAANVLILGDSLSANEPIGLASQVFEHLKSRHHVVAIGSCGSSPRWYQSDIRPITTPCGFLRKESDKAPKISARHVTPKLETLAQKDLDLAVIQQGTNLYGYLVGASKKTPAKAAQLIKSDVIKFLTELAHRSPKSQCLWVAPPKIAKYDGHLVSDEASQVMFESIQLALEQFKNEKGYSCSIHDSRMDTTAPGGDGTHFSNSRQTMQWIKSVNEKVDRLLSSQRTANNSQEFLTEDEASPPDRIHR